jgi:hypothetical protein
MHQADRVCLLPKMLPLPMCHGLPLGQIFAPEQGSTGFRDALFLMSADLPDELGYLNHPIFCRWLDAVALDPATFQVDWVSRADIKDSIVTPSDTPTDAKPFVRSLFSLDYGLVAFRIHRDCALASMPKTTLAHYLSCEANIIKYAFPKGCTLHGAVAEACPYMWIFRPPKYTTWLTKFGFNGFIDLATLPPYFSDFLIVHMKWKEAEAWQLPLETLDESQARLDEADEMEYSSLATSIANQVAAATSAAGKRKAVPADAAVARRDTHSSFGDSGLDLLDGSVAKALKKPMHAPGMAAPPEAPVPEVQFERVIPAPAAAAAHPTFFRPAFGERHGSIRPFGKGRGEPHSPKRFDPFSSATDSSKPAYTSFHSLAKESHNDIIMPASAPSALRSLGGPLTASLKSTTDWTFDSVHVDNKLKRGFASLSFATVMHDVTWEGFTSNGDAIPEQWKLFPGVIYPSFRDKFFGASSSGADACEWLRQEYRQDQLARTFGTQPLLQCHFADAFWCTDVFENLHNGKWGSYHPVTEADISQNFSVFAFLLSVVPLSSWPPKLPATDYRASR